MDIQIGQIVIASAGREKGGVFAIVSIEGDYVYLSDGKTRLLSAPKKKKLKHVRPTKTVYTEIAEKISSSSLLDADLRRFVKAFLKEVRLCQGTTLSR